MALELSLLYPPNYDRSKEEAFKDYDFVDSLQLNDMIVIVKKSYCGFNDLNLESFFTTSPEVLRYRLGVVRDLVENDALYQTFCRAVTIICNISDMKRALSSDFTAESALGSIRHLEMYQEIVNLFADTLNACEPQSEGMKEFKKQIFDIYNSEEYRSLNEELSKIEINFGYIKSVTIGLNLDENLRPREAGIVSINKEPFRAGTIMDKLLKKNNDSNVMLSPLYPLQKGLRGEELKVMNYALSSGLHTIFSKSLRDFQPMVQNYFNVNTAVFVALLDEIRFLTAGVGFIRSMKENGFDMCCPVVAAIDDKKCELESVYNPKLALSLIEDTIISNSFEFDDKGRFYIVTGPNHGGKSVFAYAVGMAQALFQLGLYVPAKSAHMSPVTGIYTHFPTSDENNYGKGRLESECARLSGILKKLTDTDMLIMDESFSSTSGLEAGYIATEVLTGIGVIGCCGMFVTHIHDLPQKLDTYNSHPANKGKIDNLVALMESKKNGTRSYKISRSTPDGLSYARDIASRYGLDLKGIMKGN